MRKVYIVIIILLFATNFMWDLSVPRKIWDRYQPLGRRNENLTVEPSKVRSGRPSPCKRNYFSIKVEALIADVSSRIADPTIRKMFENCFPSTLDTTILFHRPPNPPQHPLAYTYIITGDIKAMWVRDSTHQLHPYIPLAKDDPPLRNLILGVINTQAEFILSYPFGNAFFPLKHWNSNISLDPPDWGLKDTVYPAYNKNEVFEAKYELDSLASFLYLTKTYYDHTGDATFLDNPKWKTATDLVIQTMRTMQSGSFEGHTPPYKFTRPTKTQSETQNLAGLGNPVRRCGLIRSAFRPSDDSTIFQYLIPSNALTVVGLQGVARLLKEEQRFPQLSEELENLAIEVEEAIGKFGVVNHPEFGKVYAYEVDCYGSHLFMDDANLPSLLSLPVLGYTTKDSAVYLNTRKYILSTKWNPYYIKGVFAEGVGSPHTGLQRIWPMALCIQGMTSYNDEKEVRRILWTLRNTTGGTGFMHESFKADSPFEFGREWFAWANSLFGDFILYLDKEYPHLLREISYSQYE